MGTIPASIYHHGTVVNEDADAGRLVVVDEGQEGRVRAGRRDMEAGGVCPTLNDFDNGSESRATVLAVNLRGREGGAMPEVDDVASLRAAEGGSSRSYIAVMGDTTHALTSEGHDASEDGTGRGTPIISVSNDSAPQVYEDKVGALKIGTGLDIPSAPSVLAPTLSASNDPSRSPQSSEVTAQVEAMQAATSQVRRLTPRECERLQGFPDDWTAGQADSARYRQMGNAVAVPVVEWIIRRLVAVDAQ